MQKRAKQAGFEVLQKSSNMPCVVWAKEFKTGLGFEKSDLVMTTSQQRPNVQLPGNPALVVVTGGIL